MARLPRLSVPGLPHHIIQRGNNRQPVFLSDADRRRFLDLLQACAADAGVAVHAYVLMDNHFHLLVTPPTVAAMSGCMQSLGRAYVRYFNDLHGRSGTLWDGRYRGAVLQPERHLLPCMVYMDLNPVRSGLVALPEEHAWSSYQHYTGRQTDKRLTAHPLVWGLGNTPFDRESRYRDLVQQGLAPAMQKALTDAALAGWVLGDPAFVANLQQFQPRRLTRAAPGRPRRAN